MGFSIGNIFKPTQVTPISTPDKPKQGEKASADSFKPTNSYQDQAKITDADQKARLAKASEAAKSQKLRDKAAQLVSSKANHDAAAFEATATSWSNAEGVKGVAVVEEVVASYITEQKNKDEKNFDVVAMAKAIALVEHERDFIKSKPSDSSSRANIFPEVKDKKEALNEAIVELFKATNHTDTDEALESFKNVGSGALHEHSVIAIKAATTAMDLAYQFFAPEKKKKEVVADTVGKAMALEKAGELKEGLKEILEGFGQLAEGDPTAKTIVDAIKIASKVAVHVAEGKVEEKEQYFKGAEELAPTIVPKKTASVENAKDILSASLGTKDLADANKVDKKLVEATKKGKEFIGKKKQGKTTSSLQIMQKEMSDRNKIIKEIKTSLEDGKRVIQAEQDYKSASRNEKIDGPGKNMKMVKKAQKGVALGAMVGSVCGAGLAAPATAFVLNQVILTAYHLGGGAMNDGVEKMVNILESTLKSDDLIDTDQISRRQIADLYGEYSNVAKKFGEGSAEEVAAKEKLKTALDGKIKIDVITNALQTPIAVRMENGKKIFEGEIAKNLEEAQKLKGKGKLTEEKKKEIKENIKKNMTDLANVNTALSLIDDAMQIENEEKREAGLNKAYEKGTQLLANIDNKDFQTLFTGTLQQQLGALHNANGEYVNTEGKMNELEKIKNKKLTAANATLDIQFKKNIPPEIDDAMIDQMIEHGAVPKALNFSVAKLDGGIESVEVPLTNTKAYYQQHVRTKTYTDKAKDKVKGVGDGVTERKNKLANSLFGTACQATVAQMNLKSTRDARHRLPDDMLKAKAVLAELESL